MSDVGQVDVEDGVAIITIDSPPVNALGALVRQSLDASFRRCAADDAVEAIVLICGGRTFFAGADISEFGRPIADPDLAAVFAIIEDGTKPVIAAIHGTALGGGLELALVCHYRIALQSAKMGLPEVSLGLLPGAGGTQRLPRIVGAAVALELITSGSPVSAAKALELGIIDALAHGDLRREAVDFARSVVSEGRPLVRVRDREDRVAEAQGRPELFAEFRRQNARAFRGLNAPENIIKAIEAAVELPFNEGMRREEELFVELRDSVQSAALRHIFFAEREAAKIADVPKGTATRSVGSVGVIGAGTMGGGIAMCFLNIGLPVTLVELRQDALDRGILLIRRNYEGAARKGRMTQQQVEIRMSLLTPTLSLDALAEVDLVIEAVFEGMAVKRDVFGKLDAICKPHAILASNTSFLDLDVIAASTTRPESVIGLHFFSPANVMKLLEVVRGEKTSIDVIATAMDLARKIRKVPVVARVCHGFIANRVMEPYMKGAEALVLKGPSPSEVDKAIYEYGFGMGPFQMIDLVGLDVIGRDSTERTLSGDLVARGRLGQKSGGGFYDYDDNRTAIASSIASEVIAELAEAKGVSSTGIQAPEAIVAELLYPVVNEGAKILEEGIAMRASDIDVAAIHGYNWPVHTGGPMFWADTVGLQTVVDGLVRQGVAPSELLVSLTKNGGRFS